MEKTNKLVKRRHKLQQALSVANPNIEAFGLNPAIITSVAESCSKNIENLSDDSIQQALDATKAASELLDLIVKGKAIDIVFFKKLAESIVEKKKKL